MLQKQYKIKFFDCYDLFSVQTFHKCNNVFDIIKNAAVTIVTLDLCPYIELEVDGVECATISANNVLLRYINDINATYVDTYFSSMEKLGRL